MPGNTASTVFAARDAKLSPSNSKNAFSEPKRLERPPIRMNASMFNCELSRRRGCLEDLLRKCARMSVRSLNGDNDRF